MSLSSLGSRLVRRLVHRAFIREGSWDQHVWGGEKGRIGQKEKLSCDKAQQRHEPAPHGALEVDEPSETSKAFIHCVDRLLDKLPLEGCVAFLS